MAEWLTMFEGRWDVTPPLADEQFSQIPAKRGVLLLTADGDQPITLITAGSLRGRLHTRLAEDDAEAPTRRVDLRQVTRAVLWILTDSHFETDLAFLDRARAIWPGEYRSLLAWKQPWFVHVNADDAYPQFVRSRSGLPQPGRYLGPFPSGRSAEAFINTLHDGFDLCRDTKCLRTSPNGRQCSYGQMGKCLCPCDGTIGMDEYRQAVQRAAAFAAGDRQAVLDDLTAQMSAAAEALAFEKASAIKTKLSRLGDVDHEDYWAVAWAEQFQYVFIERGPNPRTMKTFLINGAAIGRGRDLSYPCVEAELAEVVAQMSAAAGDPAETDEAGSWRMGLVARYLFTSPDRQGLIIPWRSAPDAAALAEAIEADVDQLKVRAPAKRGRKSSDQSTGS